jgi:hypothetical protein
VHDDGLSASKLTWAPPGFDETGSRLTKAVALFAATISDEVDDKPMAGVAGLMRLP